MISILLPRLVFKNDWLAAVVFVVGYTFVFALEAGGQFGNWMTWIPFVFPKVAIFAYLLLRCGILATVAAVMVRLLLAFPLTADPDASYFVVSLFALLVVAVLAGFAAYASSAESTKRHDAKLVASGDAPRKVPRGIEMLLRRASVDAGFRVRLLAERADAAHRIGIVLEPAEVKMLNDIPIEQLQAMVGKIPQTGAADEQTTISRGMSLGIRP